MDHWKLELHGPDEWEHSLLLGSEVLCFEFAKLWAEQRFGRSDIARNESQYVWSDSNPGDTVVALVHHITGLATPDHMKNILNQAKWAREYEAREAERAGR